MKIFVINLARRPDRLAYMRRQLADFERVDAVDGTLLGAPHVAGFRFWCVKGYRIRPGEIGCALSHRKAYRLILERGLDVACVLEDDVRLADGFASRLDRLSADLLCDEPVVKLFAETAAGYLLNRAAARLLVSVNDPICAPADAWDRWVRRGLVLRRATGLLEIAPYCDPSVFGVTHSDIIGDARHFYANMSLPRRIVYRTTRVFGKTVDVLLEMAIALSNRRRNGGVV